LRNLNFDNFLEINCQTFDKEPESCKFWVTKGECNLNPVMLFFNIEDVIPLPNRLICIENVDGRVVYAMEKKI